MNHALIAKIVTLPNRSMVGQAKGNPKRYDDSSYRQPYFGSKQI